MNNPQIIVKNAPFKRFCMSIGAIPTSYLESLDYYETLLWLIKYLEETIIPTVNNNGEAVSELQTLYIQLKDFVENYFANLDVQEEINNKLDDMVEDGSLQEIIGEYLNANALWCFDTVEDMKSSTNLINGSYAKTLGYYSIKDGGNANYKIREITNDDINNDLLIPLENGLVAELLIEKETLNVKQLGAKGDGSTNDTTNIQKAIDIIERINGTLYIPNGTYLISSITFSKNINVNGENTQKVIFKSINNNTENYIVKISNNALSGGKIKNFSIDGNKENNSDSINGLLLYQDKYLEAQNGGNTGDAFNLIENIQVFNCTGNGVETEVNREQYSGLFLTELTLNNIQSVNNDGVGFHFTSRVTDSYLKNCTAVRNTLNGFKIDGSNNKLVSCKAFVNGRGDYTTLEDIKRIPSTAFTEYTGEYVEGVTYYTRIGNGSYHKPYVYSVFTGTEFEQDVTYYTLTTPYYKKYSGFLVNASFCNMIQCEAQENFGDGFYITQPLANLTNIKGDNNGIIVDEGLPPLSSNQKSYSEAGLTQLYYGVYLENAFRSLINGEFYNFRYNQTGSVQKAPLFIERGFQESGIITCNLQQYDVVFSSQSRGDVDVVCNTHPYIYSYTLSDLTMIAENTELSISGDTGSYLKKIKDIIYYRIVIHATDGNISQGASTERVIFKFPEGFRPVKLQSHLGILSGSAGFNAPQYCDALIYTNGNVGIRTSDTTHNYAYAILEGSFPIA